MDHDSLYTAFIQLPIHANKKVFPLQEAFQEPVLFSGVVLKKTPSQNVEIYPDMEVKPLGWAQAFLTS